MNTPTARPCAFARAPPHAARWPKRAAHSYRGVTCGASLAVPRLTQQVLQELKRYGSLIGRPVIAKTLEGEKDALAKQVRRLGARDAKAGHGSSPLL